MGRLTALMIEHETADCSNYLCLMLPINEFNKMHVCCLLFGLLVCKSSSCSSEGSEVGLCRVDRVDFSWIDIAYAGPVHQLPD